MRQLAASLSFAAIICSPALAQDSGELDSCMKKADTQLAIHVCASEELGRVKAESDEVYRKVLSAATNSPYEPDAIAKITSAEKAWVAYRDAYLEALFPAKDKQAIYGSIFTTTANLVLAKRTRQHMEALNDLLRHYTGVPGY